MPDTGAPIVVVAPDSFKSSLTSAQVAAAIAGGLERALPAATIRICPMADGGEGTVDAILSRGGQRHTRVVTGAGGHPRRATFGLIDRDDRREGAGHAGGPIAVVEVAEIVGITDPAGMSTPVSGRSTRGVGELLRALLDAGVGHVMLGLGGSSTNDGGAGLLAALGVRFLDGAGQAVDPTPAGLARLASVDARDLDARVRACAITILSDVTSPLAGPRGATAVFGPQKGLRGDEVPRVDAVLARYGALTEAALRDDLSAGGTAAPIATRPGAGAAGGLGFAARLLGGHLASGAQVVADLVGLDQALDGAAWAITGEGRSDAQTLAGKAPFVVAERARRAGVPTTLLSGAIDDAALDALGAAFAGCFALPARPMTLDACIADAARLLGDRAAALGGLARGLMAPPRAR